MRFMSGNTLAIPGQLFFYILGMFYLELLHGKR